MWGWCLVRGPAGSRHWHLWDAVCQDAWELNPQCWCLRRGETKVTAKKKKKISLCLIVTNNRDLLCIWKDFCHINYRCSLSETWPRFNGKGVQSLWCLGKVVWLCRELSCESGAENILPNHGSGAGRKHKCQVCSGGDARVGLCVPLPFWLVDPCAFNFACPGKVELGYTLSSRAPLWAPLRQSLHRSSLITTIIVVIIIVIIIISIITTTTTLFGQAEEPWAE